MSLSNRDNSFGKASNLGSLSASRSLRGTVGQSDRRDFLQFSLAGRSRLDLSLAGQSDSLDLLLYNGGRRLIQQSRQSGRRRESIQADLDAGNYYLQIRTRSRLNRVNYGLSLRANALNSDGDKGVIVPTGVAPVVSVNQGLRLGGGGSASISGNLLRTLDRQQGAAQLTYTLTSSPKQGTLFLNGRLLGERSTFTQADLDRGAITYQNQPKTTPLDGTYGGIQGDKVLLGKKVGEDLELFLFNGATGSYLQLTNNTVNDQPLQFDGSTVVWRTQLDTVGTELFTYNIATGQAKQLTNSPTESPEFQGLIGSKVFWTDSAVRDNRNKRLFVVDAADPNAQEERIGPGEISNIEFDGSFISYKPGIGSGNSTELFAYNVETKATTRLTSPASVPGSENFTDADQGYVVWNANSSTTRNTINLFLTNTATNQTTVLSGGTGIVKFKGMSGPNVVWDRDKPQGGPPNLYFYNGATGGIEDLFANPGFNIDTQETFKGIVGSNVVWSSFVGTDTELRLHNGSETIALTDNDKDDTFLGMSATKVLWRTENEIYAYDIATRSRQLINNGAFQDLKVNGANAVWKNATGNLVHYNGNTGKISQLTNTTSAFVSSPSTDDGLNIYWSVSSASANTDDSFYYNATTDQTTWLFRDLGRVGASGANAVGGNILGQFFYSNGSFASADNFSFTVSDGTGNTVNGTFNITVG